MPNFYYSNPTLGVGISNLAEAMIGDPTADVKAGLLGDRRRTEQVKRSKLEAEALQKQIQAREMDAAYTGLPATVAALTGTLPPEQRDAAGAGLRFALGAGAGSNSSQLADTVTELTALALARGGDAEQRQSLIARGRQPTEKFAGTQERADQLIATDAENALMKALGVQGLQNEGAMDRTVVQEAGRNSRAKDAEAGRNARADAKLKAGTGGKGKTPIKIGGGDVKAMDKLIGQRVNAAAGPDPLGTLLLDPAVYPELTAAIGQSFQDTRNLPLAVNQGWDQVMGLEPTVTQSGNWSPAPNRTVVSKGKKPAGKAPEAPAPAKGPDPAVALAEARAAIDRGADPAAVRQRLQELGIDPAAL